jgi:hypothetical protein
MEMLEIPMRHVYQPITHHSVKINVWNLQVVVQKQVTVNVHHPAINLLIML